MQIKQIGNPKSPSKYNRALTPFEQVLDNRGVDDVVGFFDIGWQTVQTPHALNYIENAAEMLLKHLKTSKTIAIIIDSDMDGFTSAAILYNYIFEAQEAFNGNAWDGNHPNIKFLFHDGKTHGLTNTKIMKDIRDTVKPELLIIPDASGTAEQYKALTDLGIEILVLDHHQTPILPTAENLVIVNNQQSDVYDNKQLSGVGVVWQLLRVLDEELCLDLSVNYMDLLAAGLVADVMNLQSRETRFLVLKGLETDSIESPLIKHILFSNYKLNGKELTPTDVAFYIAPLFNAISRIGSMEEKEMLFKSLLYNADTVMVPSGNRNTKGEMVPLVAEAYRLITNAKSRQARRQDKLMELIDQVIQDEMLTENKVLIITIQLGDYNEEHRNLAGLVANKLQEFYQRPVIIIFQNEKNVYTGSCRAPDTIEAFEGFRQQCIESKLCLFAEGHEAAFGISMTGENVIRLQDYFNEKYAEVDVSPTYYCDFILDSQDSRLSEIIMQLGKCDHYWGQGIKEPLIAIQNVLVGPSTLALVGQQKGKPTLRIEIPGPHITCIKFGSSQEEFDSLKLPFDIRDKKEPEYYNVTIVGRAQINEFRGKSSPQILIEDYEINGVEYDF